MKLTCRAPGMLLALTSSLCGCTLHGTGAGAPPEAWLGQWNGPEGTFLRLEGGDGRYQVTIQDLDGPQVYQGIATGSRIRFDRRGVQEFVHATNGVQTGMKWLADKHDCLTVRSGEGYCRD